MCHDSEENQFLYRRIQRRCRQTGDRIEQPVAQSAQELGVNVNTLHTWINKFHGEPPTGSGKQVNDVHLYEELKQLRLENARLKEERELLKKAAAFFAKEPR